MIVNCYNFLALVKKEINFQLEEFLKEKKSDCPVIRQLQATESQNMGSRFFTRLKNNSVLNSIEWLNKFQNFIENKQYPRMESIVDLNKVINYINNQVSFSNGSYKEIKLKRTEKVNEKILTILRKILTKLSSLQDNLEIWYQKLLKLINKLNNNFNKIFTEDKTRTGNGVPATRQDLFSIRWNRSPTKYNFDDKQSERKVDSVLLYKVPQLEKYYDKKKSNNSVEGEICRNNICKSSTRPTFTDKTFFSKRTEPKEKIIKTKSASENNYGKIKNKKNDKFYKGKRDHGNKKDVYNRKVGRKKEKNLHKLKKLSSQKAHDNRFEKIQPNVKNQKNNFDNLYNKRCNARKLKKNYSKKKKNFKNSKENIKAGKKILKKKSRFEKENIENFLGKTNERQKYKPRYSNQTGFWNFKWANGREKFRRHQTLGDWQFDRARARKFSRTSDGDWQFDRARARRELRNACPLDSWFVWFRQKRV